ncbi:flippase [Pseudalkalibacillus hwajinpoensis]|uniref:flippase n=1 Tax=Guptibacillus hwajinpoensis TaxID=208199 RepID=UPI001CFD9600|nr:flippase [Pseudalkalibacillus hwajinpoensis]
MNVTRVSNIIWILISNLILLLANFGVSILLANYLGVNDFGIFMLAYTVFNYLIVFNNFGLKKYVVAKLSSNQLNINEIYSSSIIIRVCLSFVAGIILLIILDLFNVDTEKKISIMIFFIAAFFIVFDLQAFYDSYEKSKNDSMFLIIRNVLYFTSTLALVYIDKASVIKVSVAFLISTFLYIFMQYFHSKKVLPRLKFVFNINQLKVIFLGAFPLFWSELMINIYDKADIIMLSILKGDQEVGIYSVAARLVAAIILLVGAAYRIILPTLSKEVNLTQRNEYIENAVKYLGVITIPLTVGGIVTADQIITIFFSDDYHNSILPFQLLILNVLIVGIGSVFGTLLLAIGEIKYYTLAITFGAIINTVGNLFLIPKYSYIGASISTIIAQLVVSGVGFWVYKRICNPKFKLKLGKVVFISMLMGGVAFCTSLIANLLVVVLVSMIFYLLFLQIFKVINLKEQIIKVFISLR